MSRKPHTFSAGKPASPFVVPTLRRRALAGIVMMLVVFGGFPTQVAAQVGDETVETIGQDSSLVLAIGPDADGWPVGFSADVVVSADLEDFVVDVYVDGVLTSSEQEPASLSVEFDAIAESRSIRVEVREFGETLTCEVDNGLIQLQNITVTRVRADGGIPLLNEPFWTIEADSSAEVANVAAIGTLATTVEGFRVAEDAVVVSVGPDQEFESSQDLWDQISTESIVVPGTGERLIVTERTELTDRGGEVFISESEFGGRVGSVRLTGEVLLAPQANDESGYALRINDEIIETGLVDANGQASIDIVVDEDQWPRDATITLDLSLVETDRPCSDDRLFSGQVEFIATPLGIPSSSLSVSDFPAVLLEGTSTLFAADGVSAHDVAVVSSALQATSVQRIVLDDAESRASARVVVDRGEEGSVIVADGQLIVTLNDATVELLQEERFWIFNDEALVDQDSVEVLPESLAFVEFDDGPPAIGPEGLSLARTVPFALLVLLVAAVLSLLWKNSKAPAES